MVQTIKITKVCLISVNLVCMSDLPVVELNKIKGDCLLHCLLHTPQLKSIM